MPLVLKYLIVFAWSMAKFLFGPIFGEKLGLSFIETSIFTILGGTATSIIIMLGGERLREVFMKKPKERKKKKKVFSKKNRLTVKIWRKYGIIGIAFLTPVLLSPIGGPIIASILGAPTWKTIRLVFLSCLFWGPITTAAVYGLFDFMNNLF